MRHEFICCSGWNTPGVNKRTGRPWADATGAFIPEARAYRDYHNLSNPILRIDTRQEPKARFNELIGKLVPPPFHGDQPGRYERLVFLCHGYEAGLQFGCRMANVGMLARHIARVSVQDPKIVLYACSTGGDNDGVDDERRPGPGDKGGWADSLRDALALLGLRPTIYAHTTAGHCTENPYVRVLRPSDDHGGEWVVEPGSRLWPAWVRFLKGPGRFMFHHIPLQDLEQQL